MSPPSPHVAAPAAPAAAPSAAPAAGPSAAIAPPPTVDVRLVDDLAGATAVVALFDEVWATTGLISPATAMAIQHAGGYLAGAWDGDRLVGGSVGFLGFDDGDGRPRPGGERPVPVELHSHITGVLQPGGGVGLALRRHQADWCRRRGVRSITWTVDPLVARNAYFNHGKLGATATAYLLDHYGPMPDGVNRGVPTGRHLVRWDVSTSAPAVAPATPPSRAARLVEVDPDGRPVVRRGAVPAAADLLAVAVPTDVLALRRSDPATARAWGSAVRGGLAPALAEGWVVTGATRDGSYLLTRPAAPEGVAP
jgi:predicted GNAT superfamily acetyltransferase